VTLASIVETRIISIERFSHWFLLYFYPSSRWLFSFASLCHATLGLCVTKLGQLRSGYEVEWARVERKRRAANGEKVGIINNNEHPALCSLSGIESCCLFCIYSTLCACNRTVPPKEGTWLWLVVEITWCPFVHDEQDEVKVKLIDFTWRNEGFLPVYCWICIVTVNLLTKWFFAKYVAIEWFFLVLNCVKQIACYPAVLQFFSYFTSGFTCNQYHWVSFRLYRLLPLSLLKEFIVN